jgi:hypothetical protein
MFGMSLSPPPPPNAEQLALEAASDLRDLAFKYANAKASGIKLSAEEDEAASLAFVNEWLGATSDSAVGLLLVQLVGIRCISPAGLIQLTVDLDYIRYQRCLVAYISADLLCCEAMYSMRWV